MSRKGAAASTRTCPRSATSTPRTTGRHALTVCHRIEALQGQWLSRYFLKFLELAEPGGRWRSGRPPPAGRRTGGRRSGRSRRAQWRLLRGRVLQPLHGPGGCGRRVAVAHGHDQREAELLAVGRGQLDQLLVLLVAQDGQAQGGLVATESAPASPRRPVGAEVRVRRDQFALLFVGRARRAASWKAARRSWVSVERPAVPGPLHRPGRALEQRAERLAERPRGSSALTSSSGSTPSPGGRRRPGRGPADVVEDEVQQDRDEAAQGDAGAEDDPRPFRHRLGDGG